MRTYCGSKHHMDVVGEEDLLEQHGVGEVDFLSGLMLLCSMTVMFSPNSG